MSKELRAKTGTYTDASGAEKASYVTIGKLIERERGDMIKLDSIPLNWDGWAYISEPKSDGPRESRGGKAAPAPVREAREDKRVDDDSESIPF